MSKRRLLTAAVCALGALATPAAAEAVTLRGTVGPGFTIELRNEAGAIVTALDPGTYEIEVRDLSEFHNFHLSGPGVNFATDVGGTGTVTWVVTFQFGIYTYVCDPHSESMNGRFSVGGAPFPEPPPPPPPPPPAPANRLVATVGPGFTITLTLNGRRVRSVRPGTYTIVVRDRSGAHNFHLTGPGLNRRTSVAARRTTTWRLRLRRGTYRYVCDPHAAVMKGSFRVR